MLLTTRYLDAALAQLRTEDAARLSPFRHRHVDLLGLCSSLLPVDLTGGGVPGVGQVGHRAGQVAGGLNGSIAPDWARCRARIPPNLTHR